MHVPARSSCLEASAIGGFLMGTALCHLFYLSCTGPVSALLDVSTAGQCGLFCAVQLWRPQEWVQARVDYKLRALASYPQPTIGFHIRGGDKGEEDVLRVRCLPCMPLLNYYPALHVA